MGKIVFLKNMGAGRETPLGKLEIINKRAWMVKRKGLNGYRWETQIQILPLCEKVEENM